MDAKVRGLRPGLVIYRKRPQQIGRLPDGAAVASGDTVQVSYVAAGNHHGVVVSADGSGVVTLHHPAQASGSTQLLPRGEHPLPHAFQLDDAPAFERFFFVTSARRPIDVATVMAAAEAWAVDPSLDKARLPLTDELQQASLTLRKETSR